MSRPERDGGPAFPAGENIHSYSGMSLRDYFTAAALPLAHADYVSGVIREHDLTVMFGGRGGLTRQEIVAAIAHRYADYMLGAREGQ